MDIRDELDAMLNNLKNGTPSASKPEPRKVNNRNIPAAEPRKSVYDKMSVDELVSALSEENKPEKKEPVKTVAPQKTVAKQPVKTADKPHVKSAEKQVSSAANNGIPKNILDMLGDSAKEAPIPKKQQNSEPVQSPKSAKKKRIVISNELPDYEEIRRRSLEENEKKAAEKAKKEAEEKAQREAAEKAEKEAEEKAQREAAEKAKKEAEEKAQREAAEKAKKEAEEKAQREAAEKAKKEAEEKAQREAAEKAEKEAEEKAQREAAEKAEKEAEEKIASDAAESEDTESEIESESDNAAAEKPKKKLFAGIKSIFSRKNDSADEEDEEASAADEDDEPEISDNDSDYEDADESENNNPIDEAPFDTSKLSASELIDLALAANEEDLEPIEGEIIGDESGSEDESDAVGNLIAEIREDAADVIVGITESDNEVNAPAEKADSDSDSEKSEATENGQIDIDVKVDVPKKKGRIVSALEKILDEDPAAVSNEPKEKPEADEIDISVENKNSGKVKRAVYTVCGVIFTLLAVVGLVSSISYGVNKFRSFSAGETKRDSFNKVIYPAVIMDIESFNSPSELASDQVISAALWSLVMSGDFSKYTKTFDIISVPAVDVEAYAAQLFGEELPKINHATVGSGEMKFYYNEVQKCYNVPVHPISFTYEPDITYVSKTGSEYTLKVDYIKELPAWMKNSDDYTPDISKTVEFKLIEKDNSYVISSMTVIEVNSVA